MALLQVKAFIKETNLGLIMAGIQSNSDNYIDVPQVIRTEDIQTFFPVEGKIVIKFYNGEYLIVSGELVELQYEIDTAENCEMECEVEMEE